MKNKKIIPSFVLMALFSLTACNGGSDWNKVGTSNTINYCLLIGQIDHNDSSARTAGIRDVLGTRSPTHRTNPNTENPVVNENFYTSKAGVKYRIVEMEHGEQKSTSGTTWDQQTANETTTLWINKHYANRWKGLDGKDKYGQSISMFVSNNDGMAMGAIGSVRWVTGMPIFGYDCNDDVVNAIVNGKVTGTVDQSGTGQAAAIYMVARNLIDHPEYTNKDATKYGFSEQDKTNYGYVKSGFQQFDGQANAMLCRNVAVTKANVEQFYGKTVEQKLEQNERIVKDASVTEKSLIYHSYYSSTDNFLNSTMKPLFENLMDKFNFDPIVTFGNGNDEATALDNLNTNLAKGPVFKAFILNMVKTTSTKSYLDPIYNTYCPTGTGKVEVPIIFWNRQPTTEKNEVDTEIMHDPRFKNILYVGFDAKQGGRIQGQMIADYLIDVIEGGHTYE